VQLLVNVEDVVVTPLVVVEVVKNKVLEVGVVVVPSLVEDEVSVSVAVIYSVTVSIASAEPRVVVD
jgi:hypothetical protein